MPDYRVKGTDLSSVAEAIRTKGGTSGSLSFPDGFVSAIQNIPSGGGSTLVTKTITANGTYDPAGDNADGYSSVTVAVASKLVSGTFTGITGGSGLSVSVPYSGSGYPVSVLIYPSTGARKSGDSMSSLVQKNAIILYSAVKNEISSTPSYDSTNSENASSVFCICKDSTSDATVSNSNRDTNANIYRTYPVNSGLNSNVRFANATTMNVYIRSSNDSGYGFATDIEYTYEIVYSS